MILYTDIGKDVDDAIAVTYAIVAGLPLRTIVVTTKDAKDSAYICRNLLNSLELRYPICKTIRVLIGSSEPLRGGESHPNIYQGSLCHSVNRIEEFDPHSLIPDESVVISPLTDFVGSLRESKVTQALFMGQVIKNGLSLDFDSAAYNFRCDPFASEIASQYQATIPYSFIGKNLAYQVPLTEADFDAIGRVPHPAMQFIRDHALQSHNAFKTRMPEIWERIYKGTGNIAYCYDPLTMMALSHPGLFTFEKFGQHKVGMAIEADKAKQILISTLVQGLS